MNRYIGVVYIEGLNLSVCVVGVLCVIVCDSLIKHGGNMSDEDLFMD